MQRTPSRRGQRQKRTETESQKIETWEESVGSDPGRGAQACKVLPKPGLLIVRASSRALRDRGVRHGTRTGYSGNREKIPWQNPQQPHLPELAGPGCGRVTARESKQNRISSRTNGAVCTLPWQKPARGGVGGWATGVGWSRQAEFRAVLGRHRATGLVLGFWQKYGHRQHESFRAPTTSHWHPCQLVKLNAPLSFSVLSPCGYTWASRVHSPQSALNKNRPCSSEMCFTEHLLCAEG